MKSNDKNDCVVCTLDTILELESMLRDAKSDSVKIILAERLAIIYENRCDYTDATEHYEKIGNVEKAKELYKREGKYTEALKLETAPNERLYLESRSIEELTSKFLMYYNSCGHITDRDADRAIETAYEYAEKLLPLADKLGRLKDLYIRGASREGHGLSRIVAQYLQEKNRTAELEKIKI